MKTKTSWIIHECHLFKLAYRIEEQYIFSIYIFVVV